MLVKWISWLNVNSGAVQGILTFVYVVTTLFLAWFSLKTVQESKQTREDSQAPAVFPSFHIVNGFIKVLSIKNYGGSVAQNVKIMVGQQFLDYLLIHGKQHVHDELSALSNGKLTITPEQQLLFALGGTELPIDSTPEFSIHIKFVGGLIKKNEYETLTNFDFPSFGGVLMYGPELDQAAYQLGKKLDKITDQLKEINIVNKRMVNIYEKSSGDTNN